MFILQGTADRVPRPSGSQFFYDKAGSSDKTLKMYEGHYHDLLNDLDKELVMADIQHWIDGVSARQVEREALGRHAWGANL